MTVFAEQLKQARQAKNLSQEDLATKLYLSRQSISKWETGESSPDLDNLVKLVDILEISLDELVLGKKQEPEVIIERVVEKAQTEWTTQKIIKTYWMVFGNLLLSFAIIFIIWAFLHTAGAVPWPFSYERSF